MKRFIAVISILLLVFWSFSAIGEGIDLSSMSEQELYELEIAIKEELASRDEFSEVILYQGEYIVGVDIPVGDYIIHALSTNEKKAKIYHATVEDQELLNRWNLDPGDSARFNLTEGTMLVVSAANVVLVER